MAIIDEGKILAIGNPSEIKKIVEKEKIVEIYIDYEPHLIEDIKSIKDVKHLAYKNEKLVVTVKDRKGLLRDITEKLSDRNIKAIATVEPTLEDVFIYLTGKKLRD
ncbi:MAG: DUF4162 domain-containing protein [Thermoplasmatales archaeon]|nr:DUF4162 domain-containing protein [Thermoplasmatales archaeon]